MGVILDNVDCALFTQDFLKQYAGKAIKAQASLLPAFPGNLPIEAAVHTGVRVTGCSVCFAVSASCLGPIIVQEPINIFPGESASKVRTRLISDCASQAVSQAVQLVASGSVA